MKSFQILTIKIYSLAKLIVIDVFRFIFSFFFIAFLATQLMNLTFFDIGWLNKLWYWFVMYLSHISSYIFFNIFFIFLNIHFHFIKFTRPSKFANVHIFIWPFPFFNLQHNPIAFETYCRNWHPFFHFFKSLLVYLRHLWYIFFESS